MKATFENDMERGRGYARLRLAEVADASAGNWRFSLCRGSDQTYLGRSGWQNSEDLLEPETYTADGTELVLRIGPQVVDRLDVNENYRLALHGQNAAPQRAVLAITSINSSMMGATDKLAAAPRTAPPPPPEPAPEPTPAPEPEPQTEPDLQLTPPAPAPAKSPLPLVLLALLLLAAAAGGAWWFMNKNAAPPQTAKTEEPKKEDPKAEAPKPESGKAEEPEKEEPKAEAPKPGEAAKKEPDPAPAQAGAPAPAAPPTAREQVRLFFSGQPGGASALELYSKLPAATPEEQDAAYRLLLFAAEEGQDKAYLPLARSTDPLAPPFGSISKDAAESWAWYAKAAPANPEAAAALQKLKDWLEAEAAKGNQKAVEWIKKIAEANKK